MATGRLAAALAAALLAAACTGGSASPSPAPSSLASPSAQAALELQVYAAASLRTALARAAAAYRGVEPGVQLTVSTDSSAALEAKIEQGAPADVFLSADTANPQRLVGKGLAVAPVAPFAGNLLTVIVPAANPAAIVAPEDLGRHGLKIIAAADSVPIARYTAQWLAKVAALPSYGSDFADRYAANVVSSEDNVAALVAKVALGEGDAGVVYLTDAAASGKVGAIEIPADQNVLATYGGVVVAASAHREAAAAFLAWLAGPGGQAVLASLGFVAPPPSTP